VALTGGLLLVDKSALVRFGGQASPPEDGELCVCAITRLELLFSARTPADYSDLETALDAFRPLCMDTETFAIAATAQRELAETGEHRLPLPDLLVAACAQQHSADVLHVDRHFDRLADVLAFRSRRMAVRG
jgi:predicted nucleic acid-binding protein